MNRRRKKGWALALALLALLTLGGCTQIPVTTQAPSYAPDANPWLIDGGTLKMPAGIFWPLVALLTLGFLALCFYAYKRAQRMARLGETPYDALALGCAFALAFTLRAVLAMVFAGHPTDIACFSVWSLRMVEVGPADFYIPTLFCDYPPGYFYLNYPFAAMVKLFGLAYQSPFTTLLIKMPAILADLALAYVLMRVVSARYGRAQGSLAALLVLFNPALWVNSAMWGQIDSVLTILLVLTLLDVKRDYVVRAGAWYTVALLVKPQALIIGPVLLWYVIDYFRRNKARALLPALYTALVMLGIFLLAVIPAGVKQPFGWLAAKYFGTMTSYPYATLNAPNFYALLGYNLKYHIDTLLGVSMQTWGIIGMAASVALSGIVYFRKKGERPLLGSAATLIFTLFMFGPSIHERYIYPAIILLFFMAWRRRDALLGGIAAGLSAVQFITCIVILRVFHFPANHPVLLFCSAANLALYLLFMLRMFGWRAPARRHARSGRQPQTKSTGGTNMKRSGRAAQERILHGANIYPKARWTRLDVILLTLLTLVYGFIGLSRLGDRHMPQTYWQPERSMFCYEVDFGSVQDIAYVNTLALINDGKMTVEVSEDGVNWGEPIIEWDHSFSKYWVWQRHNTPFHARYVRFMPTQANFRLLEIGFFDANDNLITPTVIQAQDDAYPFANAFDEQQYVPTRASYMNSMYFDEVYHPRTAYEQIHGWQIYEVTHPPLGKDIMMIGISLFGMTPFGWRIMGALAGVLMVPAMYVLGKQLFKKTRYAFLTSLLFTFDFMHYAQTRIATIDSFSVLFIIVMFIFMYDYFTHSFHDYPLWRTLLPLGLCGLMFGVGAATKWICIYAGGGLALLFFYTMYLRLQEYRWAGKYLKVLPEPVEEPVQELDAAMAGDPLCIETQAEREARLERTRARMGQVRTMFPKRLAVTIAWCLLFFIVIPCLIYYASYAPYVGTPNQGGSQLEIVLRNQEYMFSYHDKLVLEIQKEPHPYESKWYTWPVMIRPIFFFMGENLPEGTVEGLSSFGNPAVWWLGFVALIWMIFSLFTKRRQGDHALWARAHRQDRTRWFILIGLAAQYVPWMFVPRSTYIYHYFATVPFLVLCIVVMLRDFLEVKPHSRARKGVVIGYCALTVLLFAMFYPLITGTPIPAWYAQCCRWLPSWVLYGYWL